MEEIQAIEKATSEEDFEKKDQTLITSDVGELLEIQIALHVQGAPCEPSQMDQVFHTRCIIGRKACELIIAGGSYTNVASTTLIDKLQKPTKMLPTPYSLQWIKQRSEVTVSK